MLKYNNYKPKYLQISDGTPYVQPYAQSQNDANQTENTDYGTSEHCQNSESKPIFTPHNDEEEHSNVFTERGAVNESNERPLKEMSIKARNYVNFSRRHDTIVREILLKNQKNNID